MSLATIPGVRLPQTGGETLVNDVHSGLNATPVRDIVRPLSQDEVIQVVRSARRDRRSLSVCGCRHAMGGQAFARGETLVDLTGHNQILHLDPIRGTVTAEAGITWPNLMAGLADFQSGTPQPWSIRQKQTGADQLTLGGALAANIHGRGLNWRPFIQDIESFTLIDAAGQMRTCSRSENNELFRLATGGYGLFGLVTDITLRLQRRQRVEREVTVETVPNLMNRFCSRIREGCLYGDFQFNIDAASSAYLHEGILSCYRTVADETPAQAEQRTLSANDWQELLWLAHSDPGQAYSRYRDHYLATHGQVYWADTQQLGVYVDHYHRGIDERRESSHPHTEMIGELYVPPEALPDFLARARRILRATGAPLVYGTIRLIRQDTESFLPWARRDYACVIFNLCTAHTPAGRERTRASFHQFIDAALEREGNSYLTYGRYADTRQVIQGYPSFPDFILLKREHDPTDLLQSDWWRHYGRPG